MKKVLFTFLSLILILFLISILFTVVTGYTFKWNSSVEAEMVHTYLIPEGFTGCASIH